MVKKQITQCNFTESIFFLKTKAYPFGELI